MQCSIIVDPQILSMNVFITLSLSMANITSGGVFSGVGSGGGFGWLVREGRSFPMGD